MKKDELDLGYILKDCPRGTKLYSPAFGTVVFDHVNDSEEQIWVNYIDKDDEFASTYFSTDGRFEQTEDSECCLFPSKDNRDWSTFKPKVKRFDPKTLKPFDKVLVIDDDGIVWYIDFFGNYDEHFRCVGGIWDRCIPYNDDTKHLVGTTDEAPEYYKYWED